jgi:hypothetical protein
MTRGMQAGVQRNANQERRIAQRERSGALANREAGKLEPGQARPEMHDGQTRD